MVSRVDLAEVQTAVHQVQREVGTRFDFRGTKAAISMEPREGTLTLIGESDLQLHSLLELVQQRLAKRGVSLRALAIADPVPAGGSTLRQIITVSQGIPADKAKQLQKLLRDNKVKVNAQFQEDQLRVAGSKKDDLQAAIAMLKAQDFGLDLQFVNYR